MLRVKKHRVKGAVIEGVSQFQIIASVSFLAAWYASFTCPWEGKLQQAEGFPFFS